MTKQEVNALLKGVLTERGVAVWWRSKFMGGRSPNEVWETDPQQVIDRAKSYFTNKGES